MKTISIELDETFANKLHNDRSLLRQLKEDLYLKIDKGIDYITFKVHNNQRSITIHLDGTASVGVLSKKIDTILVAAYK